MTSPEPASSRTSPCVIPALASQAGRGVQHLRRADRQAQVIEADALGVKAVSGGRGRPQAQKLASEGENAPGEEPPWV